ncbi:MAG: MOSC domain-containing protein [Planctomycetaceae bacterium]|nr:MOSC domain-containing protein [Planctomycetaceae bacterium]
MTRSGQVLSLQSGRSRLFPATREFPKSWTSAIIKSDLGSTAKLGLCGLEGDEQADGLHHGGRDKAVLAYAASHYEFWNARYPAKHFAAGGFGENLTVSGWDEESCCVGDQFEIGSCLFEVSQPRQPCWKLDRRWEIERLSQVVQLERRTGWYLRVLRTGTIKVGDAVILQDRPHPSFTIARALDILYANPRHPLDDQLLAELPQLSEAWRTQLRTRCE